MQLRSIAHFGGGRKLKPEEYNYPRFKPDYYSMDSFRGPKSGEAFADWNLIDQDGKLVDLSSFRGRWVVIETGSVTCPQYVYNISKMKELKNKYPDVEFLVLYVREAHPGGGITSHKSLEDKRLKSLIAKEYGEDRKVVIDDVDGRVHAALGKMPNSVYVLNAAHQVVFRGDWNIPEEVEKVLSAREEGKFFEKERFEPALAPPFLALKVIGKAGFGAVWDLFLGLPKIIWWHMKGAG